MRMKKKVLRALIVVETKRFIKRGGVIEILPDGVELKINKFGMISILESVTVEDI